MARGPGSLVVVVVVVLLLLLLLLLLGACPAAERRIQPIRFLSPVSR